MRCGFTLDFLNIWILSFRLYWLDVSGADFCRKAISEPWVEGLYRL